MDKWEGIIKSTIILIIAIYLDLVVFGPIIEEAFELGLISLKDLPNPIVLNFWRLLGHILGISGSFGIIFLFQDYINNIM